MLRPRILQIIPSLDRAGAEKQLTLLAAGLRQREFDVRVCALTRGGPCQADLQRAGVPTAVIGKRWRADPQAFWRLKRHIDEVRPDVVHTWLFAANAYGLAAARACGIRRVIAGQRCIDPWKGWAELAVDRWGARHCECVVANSGGVRDFYVAHGLPAERIRVIPNAVATACAAETTRGQILAELGLSERARLVGLVGRFWPQKRVKDAIWAADLLKVIRDDVHLLIFGDGPQRDRLLRYREQVVIRDKVHFLGQRNDLAQWLPHFDVLWSTSGYEGQSNAILEAMAAGVPVVATDIPGTRELVVPGETGFLVRVGHRAGFARWTNQLLDDAALAGRMGQAGRERAAREFSVEAMVSRYAELYGEVGARDQGPGARD
jgi:glycosyltransferase involved in cell wall biosynthesis